MPPTTGGPTPGSSQRSETGPTDLRLGDEGAAVRRLQQRLTSLGYWPGEVDGIFGDTTRQSVYALQKTARIGRDGVVGPATRRALARGPLPAGRSRYGDVIEVDLARQLVLVMTDGRVRAVLNASTGGGFTYWQDGQAHVADTPTGRFTVSHLADGWDHSDLGWLWRPAYFSGGYALHGSLFVPPYPDSHGCVRVSVAAMSWLLDSGMVGIGTQVLVY